MKIRRAGMMLTLAVLAALAGATPIKKGPPEFAEDLGAATIDVSAYPEEYQKTYKDVFLLVYPFIRGGPARALNSPLIELDPQGEQVLRREHPELFAVPGLAQVSADAWKKEVSDAYNRPPCCGACPVLSREDAKALRRFLVYDSIVRKTGKNAEAWIRERKRLLDRFKDEYPKRYEELYPQTSAAHPGDPR
jgi:hypothetical protein